MKNYFLSIFVNFIFLNSVKSIIINCEYEFKDYGFGSMYTCVDNEFKIDEDNVHKAILSGVVGEHLPTKSLNDVKQIAIENSEVMKFPSLLNAYFKNLESIVIINSKMKLVDKTALSTLNELKYLKLTGNEINLIEPELFEDNNNLQEIHLNNNSIRKISVDILSLENLSFLQLEHNQCVNFIYQQNNTIEERERKQKDIIDHCKITTEDEKNIIKLQLKSALEQISELNNIIKEKEEKASKINNAGKLVINDSENDNLKIENEALIHDNNKLRTNEMSNIIKIQENEEKIAEISESLKKQLDFNDKLTEEFDDLKIKYFNMNNQLTSEIKSQNVSLTQIHNKYNDVKSKFDNLEIRHKKSINTNKSLKNINKKMRMDLTKLDATNSYLEGLLLRNKIKI